MVMAGEWICRDEGNWDFVVDKTQMSRMVPFRDGITLSKLEQTRRSSVTARRWRV
ncbi:hypothetical protein F2Q69_00055987 [Brassica cretica]|uniref:Uncharacterized protein n=1 Tax=Brassica cretica TaxID=69181 RepID=A0A8S9MV12_BRACR|nr:hypothetical protein F2Q69_00055987 [Brassica cretica]